VLAGIPSPRLGYAPRRLHHASLDIGAAYNNGIRG
jgi:hypothetical protein